MEKDVELRQTLLAESKRVREAIEKNKDAALTQATAETSSAGQFSTPVQRVQLDKGATEQIANTVGEMVSTVLRKDYTVDACTTVLTKEYASDVRSSLKSTIELCRLLIEAKIQTQTREFTAKFGMDETSEIIGNAIAIKPRLFDRISRWLDDNTGGMLPAVLIYGGAQTAELRQRVINELGIR